MEATITVQQEIRLVLLNEMSKPRGEWLDLPTIAERIGEDTTTTRMELWSMVTRGTVLLDIVRGKAWYRISVRG